MAASPSHFQIDPRASPLTWLPPAITRSEHQAARSAVRLPVEPGPRPSGTRCHSEDLRNQRRTGSEFTFPRQSHQPPSPLFHCDAPSLGLPVRQAPVLIAGAGSGKTLTILGKVQYLIEQKNITPDNILLLSFTKKTVEDLNIRTLFIEAICKQLPNLLITFNH